MDCSSFISACFLVLPIELFLILVHINCPQKSKLYKMYENTLGNSWKNHDKGPMHTFLKSMHSKNHQKVHENYSMDKAMQNLFASKKTYLSFPAFLECFSSIFMYSETCHFISSIFSIHFTESKPFHSSG